MNVTTKLTDSEPRNVLLFLSDSTLQHMYFDRIQSHLQPEHVGWAFYAETAGDFVEITRNSAGTWRLLLVDFTVASEHEAIVAGFIEQNPDATVGIFSSGSAHPSEALRAAVLVRHPVDINDWLKLMHELLRHRPGDRAAGD